MIKHMVTTDANYLAAWKLLSDHYDNPRELFKSQMFLFSSQPKINEENAQQIRSLLSVSRECRQAISNFEIDVLHCDPVLIYFITQKLPPETIGLWETSLGNSTTLSTFDELQKFLDTRIKTLEAVAENKAASSSSKPSSTPYPAQSNTQKSSKKKKSLHITTNEKSKNSNSSICCICNESHILRKCSKFLSMSTIERRNAIEGKRICYNCLSNDHLANNCYSKHNCRCGSRHHTLIHIDSQQVTPSTSMSGNASNSKTSDPVRTYIGRLAQRRVLLSTAIVKVKNSQGKFVELRALIDKGSEASLITERASRWLNLPKVTVKATITGISDVPADSCNSIVHLNLRSNISQYELEVTAFVMQKLTGTLPKKTIEDINWPHIAQLPLADPHFHQPAKIDLLLGSDVYAQIILDGLRKCESLPTAQNTELGWILFGGIESHSSRSLQMTTMLSKVKIDELVQKFWECETISKTREMNMEEKWCEKFFSETCARTVSGRYMVRLPFRIYSNPNAVIGKSRRIAINQFVSLEKKFMRDPDFHNAYSKVFNEYLNLNEMELIQSPEDDNIHFNNGNISVKSCYLPHHAILKNSSTTQLRIVFDASRKTTNGKSLNEVLYPGPILHNDLPSIITNWRLYPVAFTADLQQMFRQIQVHPDDAQFQRVVWRDNPSQPLREYFVKTVMFGTTSAPYLAIRTVQQLAHDLREKYPLAFLFMMDCIYVDDIFGGADNAQQAIEIQKQLIDIFHEGHFHLRKWISNDERLLKSVPENDREIQLPLSLNPENSVKTLGIYWQPSLDVFQFKFNFDLPQPSNESLTKRLVLSTIARLFDPLGFITPVILPAKLMMRDLWLQNIDWDDSVSGEFKEKWYDFVQNLQLLPQLQIPRWLSTQSNSEQLQFHGFCDASTNSYAAAIYLRSMDALGQLHCHLLTSKCKIAPIKSTSIPRLELMGALLLAELFEKLLKNWKLSTVPQIYAWTDSEIVVHWINGDSNRWEIFVANRVNKINEIISAKNWNHVTTDLNPADYATRGLTVQEIMHQNQWWHGPQFLLSTPEFWPEPFDKLKVVNNDIGTKQVNVHQVIELTVQMEILHRFSSYNKLIRTTARIQALAQKARHQPVQSSLTVQQLNSSRNLWIHIIQQQEYSAEIKSISRQQQIPNKSKIANLNPFLDQHHLMRVGGRLENAALSYDEKFPLILPPQSHFTQLLILEYHHLTLHGGTQLVLTWLRKKYWIINARNTVRFLIAKCVTCYRLRAKAGEQRMGILPSPRVRSSFAFSSTGVDFAGPIEVKASKYRCKVKYKGYIAIFVCFAVRAIHIELVGDLSTSTFLSALKRFLARRNMCANIYSDCGTTFVGATNQLKAQEKVWQQQIVQEVQPFLTNRAITWHFIPPASPHFGGIWEAGVKSMKHHLKRICGDHTYTFEEWSTVLTEIEGILNSRPLCPFTSDPEDLTAITPNHFLNGDIARDLPEPDVELCNINLPARLRELVQLKQIFWRRWSSEYLNQLQSRPKWLKSTPNLQINDLVLIKDERLPPLNWLIGRIVDVHPGGDGLVRVASVRTKNGVVKRSIAKLCRMPIDSCQPPSYEQNIISN